MTYHIHIGSQCIVWARTLKRANSILWAMKEQGCPARMIPGRRAEFCDASVTR